MNLFYSLAFAVFGIVLLFVLIERNRAETKFKGDSRYG